MSNTRFISIPSVAKLHFNVLFDTEVCAAFWQLEQRQAIKVSMNRLAHAGACLGLLVSAAGAPSDAWADPRADDSPQSGTVLGPTNQLLADGSAALAAGRFEAGIRLTLAGLDQPNNARDEASGHSNACAGFAALHRFREALKHCNRSLELDRNNWRTYNNRAAVFTGLRQYELAIVDVNKGLALAPDSDTLRKSLEVVNQHRDAAAHDRWRRPNKA